MSSSTITAREYGRMPDGRPVTEYTLDNGRGLRLSAINHWAASSPRCACPTATGAARTWCWACPRWPTT
jgi:hypothetical protein